MDAMSGGMAWYRSLAGVHLGRVGVPNRLVHTREEANPAGDQQNAVRSRVDVQEHHCNPRSGKADDKRGLPTFGLSPQPHRGKESASGCSRNVHASREREAGLKLLWQD